MQTQRREAWRWQCCEQSLTQLRSRAGEGVKCATGARARAWVSWALSTRLALQFGDRLLPAGALP